MRSPVSRKAKPTAAPAPKAEAKKKPAPAKPLALKPRLSEKAYGLSELRNTYIFDLAPEARKFDVARAVAAQYEVEVTAVRITTVPGKAMRTYRQRGRRSFSGRRSDIRKAYVTLKEGDKLPIFAAMDEPEAPKETK